MAPEGRSDGRDADSGRSVSDTAAAEAALKAKLSRKRTKTGCLTCRKRRIKCGEERPVCKNCIKSKRHCEGYNQRVVFKPTFDYQPVPNGGAHITFQAGPVLASAPLHASPHGPTFDPSVYSQLRPRAPEQQYVTVFDQRLQQYVAVPQPPLQPLQHHPPPLGHPRTPDGHFSSEQGHFFQHGFHPMPTQGPQQILQAPPAVQPASASTHAPAGYPVAPISGPLEQYREPVQPPSGQALPPVTVPADQVRQVYGQPALHGQQSPEHGHNLHLQPQQYPQEWTDRKPVFGAEQERIPEHGHNPHLQPQQYPQEWADRKPVFGAEQERIPAPAASSHSSSTSSFSQTPALATQHQWTFSSYTIQPELSRPIDYQQPTHHPQAESNHHNEQDAPASLSDHKTPEYYEYEAQGRQHITPTAMLSAAAVETLDDDYWDVGSDEETDLVTQTEEQASQNRQHALSRILALNRTNSQNLQMRRYDTFISDGILEHYKVEEVASPLKNPATARVFAHFISVTGPSLSIFERHPRISSLLFAEGSVPLSQQGLWTYTMPMAALRNQGLLHAMLALASLQIARLQNASATPSMQHYAWALRRIHAAVANHRKSRLKVTTIAASLLLGFYEIMTADHMKWNMHLAGSKQLFVETDFAKMTRDFRLMKAERAGRFQPPSVGHFNMEELFSQDALLDQIPDVDENLISHLTGREVRYANHGHIETSHLAISSTLDLNKFEILKDLYWWYCKQDVYQSIVSGNPLLLDYSRWANCPPRAPLGKTDAVHGTVDHLMLLLGRVADFASRDRIRKLKQIEANGGQWRPAPGMNIPRPPQQQQPPPIPLSATSNFTSIPMQSPGEQPSMPQFFGMAPPPRTNVQMPSSYNPNYNIPTPQSDCSPIANDTNLEAALNAALEEYGQIRSALRTFSTSLGEAFEPLTSEYQTPMNTSFGTARFYRSYDIGCLWAIYNMAEIIAIRSHPHMPPAAHHAAGVAAQQTAPFANEIGRIAAGIVPGPANQPLNPTLGAAACECCMPSFFAAIQYTSPAQRHETITRIFSIAKRTGWGSVELIANGVETAWVKAAAAGRGPPYQRIARPAEYVDDPRLNGSWEHLDPNAAPEGDDEGDRRLIGLKKEARLNWAIGVMGVEDDVQKIRTLEPGE